MKWNSRTKVERPEYPKLVPIAVPTEIAKELLSSLRLDDPDAAIVDGGERGTYIKVHNQSAEIAARLHGEARSFPLA